MSYFKATECTGVGGAFPAGEPCWVFVPKGPEIFKVALAGLAFDFVGEGGSAVVKAVSARIISLIPIEK